MKFNKIINENIRKILDHNGFILDEEYTGYLKFINGEIIIVLAYYDYDKTYSFNFGIKGFNVIEINNKILKNFFKTDILFENLAINDFYKSVELFLKENLEFLVFNYTTLYKTIEYESLSASHNYTRIIIDRQNKELLDKAWKDMKYNEFIKMVESNGLENYPNSYKLKYKIAKNK